MSPDGKTLLIVTRDRISLWDLDAGKETKVLVQSHRWRNFSICWLALVIWAAIYGWESKQRRAADPSPFSVWSSLLQTLAAAGLLAGLAALFLSHLPDSVRFSFWPYYLLVAATSLVYLLVELLGLWQGWRKRVVDREQESMLAHPSLRWQWRLIVAGGAIKIGLALFLFTHFTSQTSYFLDLYRSHAASLELWDLEQYAPLVAVLCGLVGWTGLRLVSAGFAQSQGTALATLRRHQFWGWLHGDIVNPVLAIAESLLSRLRPPRSPVTSNRDRGASS
jgi:hypothetical protein